MRFMMLMIPKPGVYAGAGVPSAEAVASMSKYNDQLQKAGVLLALDGLMGPDKGARVRSQNGKRTVTDGPFAEAKEVLGGYWMLDVKSRDEAIEWAKRCPLDEGDVIELRQVFEMSDFPPDVQAAAKSH